MLYGQYGQQQALTPAYSRPGFIVPRHASLDKSIDLGATHDKRKPSSRKERS